MAGAQAVARDPWPGVDQALTALGVRGRGRTGLRLPDLADNGSTLEVGTTLVEVPEVMRGLFVAQKRIRLADGYRDTDSLTGISARHEATRIFTTRRRTGRTAQITSSNGATSK